MAQKQLTTTEKKTLWEMYLNSGFCFSAFNMVKMEGNSFTLTMAPAIDELYKDEEERKKALLRHNNFFNTHAVMYNLIAGITYALEREKMEKGIVNDDTIENVKVALMGPTAGIGDSFFFNCIRVIVAGIAIGFSEQGNFFGAILFVLLYGGSQLLAKWYLLKIGYTFGSGFIDKVFDSGIIEAITKSAAIVGLTMVGSMVASMVRINLAWTINVGKTSVVVMDVLNAIMPGMLSLILLFVLVNLIKKGVKPVMLVVGILVLSVVLAFVGIL